MADGIEIKFKRAKNLTAISASGEPIASRVLCYGEPLYIENEDIIIIGDDTSTVQELYDAHEYFHKVQCPSIYGQANYTYGEYNSETGEWEYPEKGIPTTNSGDLIANTRFVQAKIKSVLDGLDVAKTEFEKYETLASIEQTDGKISVSKQNIQIDYDQVVDTDTSTKKPVRGTETPKIDGGYVASTGKYTYPNGYVGDDSDIEYSRESHVHPTDTSRAPVKDPTLTGYAQAPDEKNGTKYSRIATENNLSALDTKLDGKVGDSGTYKETKQANISDIIYVTGVKENTEDRGQLYFYYNASATRKAVKIDCSTGVLMGAAWNDFAESRKCLAKPGTVVCETGHGDLITSGERLQAGAAVVSDTYGMLIGPDEEGYAPIAVAGRVLVNYIGNASDYKAGDAVCAGPFGRIDKMTREEIKEYPDRILGYVSEIPSYEEWNNIKINNRIWIKIK